MTKKLTKRMKIAIWICGNPGVTLAEVSEEFKSTKDNIGKVLRRLVEIDILVRESNGKEFQYYRHPEYRVPEIDSLERIADPWPDVSDEDNPTEKERLAEELERRGLYRRAATVLTDALKGQRSERAFIRICRRRSECFRNAKKIFAPETEI